MRVRTMYALLSGVEKQHTPILDTLSSAAEAEIIQPNLHPTTQMLHGWENGAALVLARRSVRR